MKVGILTFHYAYNYGAVLQAYASACVLRELGHDPEIVNYVPAYFFPMAFHFRGLGFRNGAWRTAVPERIAAMPRRLAFDRFRRTCLPMSARVGHRDLTALGARYDVFYVGSDQVWNLNWMYGFDGFYFCDFLSSNTPARAIAYAPCFGTTEQPEERLRQAGPLIRRFSAVGTRNRMSANIAKEISGVDAEVVCDPTMLHDFCAIRRPQRSESCIVVYSLDESGLHQAEVCCDEIRKRNGPMPIWFIGNDRIPECAWADRVISAADPAEWMNLIADAGAVVTDSFHGCIFAMKFGRTLRAYSSGWRAGRIIELFASVGVSPTVCGGETPSYLWRLENGDGELWKGLSSAITGQSKNGIAWLDGKISGAEDAKKV